MSKELPADWKWIEVGQVCDVVTGTTPPKSDPSNYGVDVPFFKPPHLWDSVIDDTEEKLSEIGSKKSRVVPPNTVLVTCIGNLGRTGITKKSAAFNQQINAILENDLLAGKYIFYQAQSSAFRKQLESLATGTTVSIVNKRNFETIKISVPPADTQKAIVAKVEALFSEVDKGMETLRTAQQQLKVYRQSVLKWAFEGKLTNADVKEGELPAGWKFAKLRELGTWKGGGTPSKLRKDFWEGGTIQWVSPKDMKSMRIVNTIDKITPAAVEGSTVNLIPAGSILFVVRSGILRRTLPIALTACEVTVNQDMQAFTPKDLLPEYVYWFAVSAKEAIRSSCSKDGTTVESIDTSSLKDYKAPICSFEEQRRTVQKIEARLSVCDKIEETITKGIQQAEALKQSILKKAFEGKL